MQIGIRALDESLNLQKIKKPLIHCINNSSEKLKESIINYNGKPIFTDILKEYVELTSKANSLLIYLKDLNEDKIEAIEKSIRIARRKGILVVLDILGANLSFPIREMALRFINRYNINVVTGKVEEFKVLVLNDKTLIEEENINYKIREDNSFRIRLKRFSKNNNTILVIKSDDYYLTDGFSEFFINRYINEKNKSLDIEAMLSGLISVGVASASNNEERFISVLVAIMTMAVSEKKAEQKNLIYSEDISFMKYLEDEIKNINANELIKLSKIDYLFTR
ncbi:MULTISPECIES: hydroxyethylthiazole kinase [unclassified Clostridium]|uniref:hydroxyethylthiazole kinase n=1 Tax=unclassified Clostridium TaxID=2614128 RepID=UPI002A81ED5F|nr:hydroxyethylthiazole kinase [Clostridium sp.]MCI6692133.1 hydroxyethylthiazole kinase [Clostridium sp.]MDY4252847.1 hydroxyethylthiazole kinase [Clostridium sp.]